MNPKKMTAPKVVKPVVKAKVQPIPAHERYNQSAKPDPRGRFDVTGAPFPEARLTLTDAPRKKAEEKAMAEVRVKQARADRAAARKAGFRE